MRIDNACAGPHIRRDIRIGADGEDVFAPDGEGFGAGEMVVHRENTGVGDDEICWRIPERATGRD